MKSLMIAACALAISLSACVENEEEITIRPDGSASLRVSAKGKVEDLADGYGVPLAAPWTATSPDTLEWIRRIGSDTGSAAVRENARAWDAGRNSTGSEKEIQLEVRADFASVEDWPRWFAPQNEVYQSAYLERGAALKIESKSGRKVYTFERVYHARAFERFDVMAQLKKSLPAEWMQRLEKASELSSEERAQVARAAVDVMRKTALAFSTDALASVYTAGDAALPLSKLDAIEQRVRDALAQVVSESRLTQVLDYELPVQAGSPTDDSDPRSAQTLERDIRSALRSALSSALAAESVPSATQNAIRGQLEWSLTAYDHTCDLADESFTVTVHMPGVIVGGNSDEVANSTATWKFDGDGLQDRERVLRVVSAVE
jgi:hypothetical protein